MNDAVIIEDSDDVDQIIGALRQYQADGMGDPDERSDRVHDVATGLDDRVSSADDKGLDELINELEVEWRQNHCLKLWPARDRYNLATATASLLYMLEESKSDRLWYVYEPDSARIERLYFELNSVLADTANA